MRKSRYVLVVNQDCELKIIQQLKSLVTDLVSNGEIRIDDFRLYRIENDPLDLFLTSSGVGKNVLDSWNSSKQKKNLDDELDKASDKQD